MMYHRKSACAKIYLARMLLVLWFVRAKAQDFNSYIYSEFSGILGVRVQPASIAGSPYKHHISFLNTSLSGSNNVSQMVGGEGSYEFQRILENDRKFIQASFSLGGLSGMFTLPNQQALGIQFQVRSHLSTNDISPDFANQFQNWQDPQILNIPYEDQTGEFAAAIWRELAITYARAFRQEGRNSWKMGITGKMINSHGSLFVELADFDYTLLGQGRADVSAASVRYGYSDNLSAFTNFGGQQSLGSIPKAEKSQFTLDLGIVYQRKANRKPIRTRNGTRKRREFAYAFKIGLSITDLGVIKSNYGSLSTSANELITNRVDPVNLNVVFARPTSLVELTDNLGEFLVTEPLSGEFTIALPTAAHLNIDYNLGKGFFLNTNVRADISSLLPADYKLHYYSNVTFTPRWESRNSGLYIPILVNQLGHVRGGAAFRMGPVVFGSQDWSTLFSRQKRSFSFFFTLNLARFMINPGKPTACFSPWS